MAETGDWRFCFNWNLGNVKAGKAQTENDIALVTDERLYGNFPPQPLRCDVEEFNFSAHATREQIADYVEKVKPKKLLLVHGEVESQAWFTTRFAETLSGTEIILPDTHQPIDLW